ncbi:hypothetical protein GCM10009665_67120 [Kitasatospora nipponensis]|uniref:Mycothiol-dependent maleylpyruvate isomerase metal-binding domain-containing protein n=1 Tax=Kitasatospora nipponensis TaxID=258049 RepID=A0ABP4HIZ8_9ACTN
MTDPVDGPELDGLELLGQAHDHLRAAVRGVPAEGWGVPTPCSRWTARQVLNHARLDQLAYAAAVTGTGHPTSDPFAPVDELDGDPLAGLEQVFDAVLGALATLPAGAESAPTPIGPLAPWLGAGAAALDAAVHGWDIAVATGQHLPLPEPLAEGLLVVSGHLVEGLRAYGVFAPALPAGPGDSAGDALLRLLGRDPRWSATPAR